MPGYNADKTLIKTYNEIPKEVVDNIIHRFKRKYKV